MVQSIKDSAWPIRCLAVTGPTCSGKTSLAIELAKIFGGEILNCDSVQFYRGFDIGSAKPSLRERECIPHHGIDILDSDESFDAGRFAKFAKDVCQEITSRGSLPLICGGSGLYLRSMLGESFSDALPDRDPVLRERIARMTEIERYSLLQQLDGPRAEKVHPHDTVRVERALELRILTGRLFSFWQAKEKKSGVQEFEVFQVHINPQVDTLRQRIAQRTQSMLDQGLVKECWSHFEKGGDRKKTPLNSIGYAQVWDRFLETPNLKTGPSSVVRKVMEDLSKDRDLYDKIFYATCQYAKRQRTWFKKGTPQFVLESGEASSDLVSAIKEFLNR